MNDGSKSSYIHKTFQISDKFVFHNKDEGENTRTDSRNVWLWKFRILYYDMVFL